MTTSLSSVGPTAVRPSGQPSTGESSATARRSRWNALLMVPGVTTNRAYRPPIVLKRAAALFEGATVRVARSATYGHGRAAAMRDTMPASVLRVIWRVPHDMNERQFERILRLHDWDWPTIQRLIAREEEFQASAGADERRYEPQPIGRVIEARFDPYEGVVGVIELDEVPIENGPFTWIGAVHEGERADRAFRRLHRAGHGDLLRLSYVASADMREGIAPDGMACLRYHHINSVQFVDVVMFASTDAHLIAPID